MVAGKIVGNLLYLSGATPPTRFGTTWKGASAIPIRWDRATRQRGRLAVIQLEMAKHILGGELGRIKQVVKVLGMVNCAPGFTDTPAVMHGFSELLFEVLGERGRHARSAVGMQALPGDAPIEVETIFEIE